jgi:hypothetical protein
MALRSFLGSAVTHNMAGKASAWLVPRLNVATYEAERTGQSARGELAVLRERASLRPAPLKWDGRSEGVLADAGGPRG